MCVTQNRTPRTAPNAAPTLGIGINYSPAIRSLIDQHPDAVDYVEVIPDQLWTDRGRGRRPRFLPDPRERAFLEELRKSLRVVMHGIGLSIGSAHRFDLAHVDELARWQAFLDAPWHSDHLAFRYVEGHGTRDIDVGVTLPVTFDERTLRRLVRRVEAIRRRVPVPFLLENNVHYFALPESEYDEPSFLNALAEQSGCGLLVDLHNLYVNARNFGHDPFSVLERLRLDHVVEVHVAGGLEHEGFYLDGHCGRVPKPVWEMLEWLVERAPRLAGITFEIADDWAKAADASAIRAELATLRTIWNPHPVPASRV